MDGVIINSEPIYHTIDSEIAETYGFTIDEEKMQKYIGVRASDAWAAIIQEENLDADIKDVLKLLDELQVKRVKESGLQPIDGIVELLEELKRLDYKIAIASSSPRVLIEMITTMFHIDTYFDCFVSGEEVERGKPNPEIYVKAASSLDVDPSNCTVLEDSKMGIEAANKAGMKTIGFQNPGSGNQDLSKAKHVVHAIDEVKMYI